MAYQTTNPHTEKVEKTFAEITAVQLEEKLHRAEACFKTDWRERSFADRTVIVKKAAALMRERAQPLAELITREMGKLIAQSLGEVALSAAILDYYADHAEQFLAPEKLTTAKGEAMVESSPIGVLFGVEPWNYPYYQIAGSPRPT